MVVGGVVVDMMDNHPSHNGPVMALPDINGVIVEQWESLTGGSAVRS